MKPKGSIPIAALWFVDKIAGDEVERGNEHCFRLIPRKGGAARTYVLKAASSQVCAVAQGT